MTIGLMLKAYDNMSGVVAMASSKAIASLGKVQERMKTLSDQAEKFGRATLANGVLAAGSMSKPLQAFARLEDATTGLKVAMMDNLGRVPAQFEEINKQAVALGNLLPGTTADFINAARALIEQGTGLDTILNGGLKSASYLSVLLKMPAQEAAEMVAKLREAYGLADNELEKMADLTQRARFAFGMAPQDIKIASSYSGATQNILGLKGLDNARKLMALQGMGAGVSLEGSSWGTNFAMLLNRTAELKDKLAKTSTEMKAVNADLNQYGINLEFFDDKGNFMGLDNLVRQLEKTKAMATQDQLNVFKRLFGVEAGRPAAIIAEKGFAGYQEALQKMEQQAALQQRIDLSLSTIKNRWEALTGTVTNALAAVGEPIATVLSPAIVWLNDFVSGPLMTWIGKHQQLVGIVGTSVLGIGLLAAAVGALSLVVGTFGKAMVGGISAIQSMSAASRVATAWLAAHRSGILSLTGVQRAHIAVQNLQNAVAYRGGIWQALQYALMTTRYRMLAVTAATRTWIATMSGQFVAGIGAGVAAMRTWTTASLVWMRANLLTTAGLRGLAVSFAGTLVSGIKGAIVALRVFSLALLTNPIGWIAAIIAAAAFLIYRYWKPISGFFAGLWQGLKIGFAPLLPAFRQFGQVAVTAFAPLRIVWGWFKAIFRQAEDTGGAARNLGIAVGQGIASAIIWVGRLFKALFQLPGKFFDAGADMVRGLWRGIQSMASKPVEEIMKLGASVAGAFKNQLGIKSPSRVFMGFGDNIGQGAAIGIQGSLPKVQQATNRLAATTTAVVGASRANVGIVGPVRMPQAGSAVDARGGAVNVHFSPTIRVNGGTGDIKSQVNAALADGYREFEAYMRRFMAEQQRRVF